MRGLIFVFPLDDCKLLEIVGGPLNMSDLEISPEARRALVQANLCRAHATTADDLTDEDLAEFSIRTIHDPVALEDAVHALRAKRSHAQTVIDEADEKARAVGVNAAVGEVFGERDPYDRRARHGIAFRVSSVRDKNGDDVYTVRYCVFPNVDAKGLVHVEDHRIIGALSYVLVKSNLGDVSYHGKYGNVVLGFSTAAVIMEKGIKVADFLCKLHRSIGIPWAALASMDVVPHVLERKLPLDK
jgi:hypothetical protein